MSVYESKYVQCPFYHRHDDNRICCEGTDSTNVINVVFGNSREQKLYGIEYCNDTERCKKCLVYKAINSKYEKEGK